MPGAEAQEEIAPAPISSTEPVVVAPDEGTAEVRLRKLLPKLEALAVENWRVADTIDDQTWLGTALNSVHIKEHTCFILGGLLNRTKEAESAKKLISPQITRC